MSRRRVSIEPVAKKFPRDEALAAQRIVEDHELRVQRVIGRHAGEVGFSFDIHSGWSLLV